MPKKCCSKNRVFLFGKSNYVTLKAASVIFFTFALIDLVQVAAHAKENAAGTGGNEERLVELIARLLQVVHAVHLCQDAALVEGINIDFLTRILETTEEMAREPDAGNG